MTDGFVFPLIITALAVAALLFLVLVVRAPAFLALVVTSLGFGLSVGMAPTDIIAAIQNGMGGTLGFIAVVVGLGAILGAVLEVSGGIQVIANSVLNRLGEQRAPWGLAGVGFLAAIPVFFDVALIILLPVLWSLREQSGRPLVLFAIPLLAGLAAAHALAPPTPGPIAVADILGADLGWVIVFGVIAGLPAVAIAGPLLARHLATLPTFQNDAPKDQSSRNEQVDTSATHGAALALSVILLPLILIVVGAVATNAWHDEQSSLRATILFIGHPFVALLAACLYAWVIATRLWRCSSERMLRATSDALAPAGAVVLVTGAGGAFKQVLVDSGAGANLAAALTAGAMPPLVFAFLIAALVRVAQGSATVAMITAAGLTAPVAELAGLDGMQLALVVTAIGCGATMASHVNDSGFWLVSRFLQFTEAQTLKSWTVSSSLIGLVGFGVALALSVALQLF